MAEISIIMATYNCEKFVSNAIESILSQMFTDWEFVICDDCSTDNTYQILQSYKKKYPDKFVLLRNASNSKLPFSLNQCLKHASGKYIARMDADDISLPERLQKQWTFLEEHPACSVVGTSMVRFDDSGDYDTYYAVKNPNKETLLREVPHCHATILMRKNAYDMLNGYVVSKRTERGQDLDLWFRFYASGLQGANLQEALYRVCEDRAAIKRRKFKYALYATQTKIKGFRLIGFPKWKFLYALQPIISYIVPRSLKLRVRQKKDKQI